MSWCSRLINQQIITLIKKDNSNGFTHDYTLLYIIKCKTNLRFQITKYNLLYAMVLRYRMIGVLT